MNSTYNLNLTANLSNNLNYDYINTMDYTQQYIFRIQQANVSITNTTTTIVQLTFSIWSGMYLKTLYLKRKIIIKLNHFVGLTIQCQIVGENLQCVLLLPKKYQTQIEGLAGNFDGNYSNDLINTQTNQVVLISYAENTTTPVNDTNILNACLSCKFRDTK